MVNLSPISAEGVLLVLGLHSGGDSLVPGLRHLLRILGHHLHEVGGKHADLRVAMVGLLTRMGVVTRMGW